MICFNDYSNTMVDSLEFIESFDIIENGINKKINKESDEFTFIYVKIKELFQNARVMPAFGVSLHNETLNEIKTGTWLQLNFSKLMSKNDLFFNSLLFKLEQTSGVNLIRLYNNKYEGRCIYLDFDELDLNELIMKSNT